jgi:hypothetical protein
MSKSPTSEFRTSAGGVMIKVPAGSFTMGSPESEDGHRAWEHEREVTFASDFYLGKTPVTQDQFEAITGTNPTRHEKIGDAPVDSVTWDQATKYCQKLTKLDREAGVLSDDWEYRLPTEAEWEYACRAGSSAPRHGAPQDVAWYHDNANAKPHAVGRKAPNAWGFHDMLGNVWEWCQDWYWGYNKSYRCIRGGSYFSSARFCRASQRWGRHPGDGGRYCGFRLLAARAGSFALSPPVDDFPKQYHIYDAIRANDFDRALRIVTADPDAVECPEGIPPPLEYCGDDDKPEWTEWLLDHGADIERLNQDYGSTPLTCAVIRRQKRAIRTLVKRGADATDAMDCAQRGLAGDFEDETVDLAKPEEVGDAYDPATQRYIRRLDREGYREIVALLRELGIG